MCGDPPSCAAAVDGRALQSNRGRPTDGPGSAAQGHVETSQLGCVLRRVCVWGRPVCGVAAPSTPLLDRGGWIGSVRSSVESSAHGSQDEAGGGRGGAGIQGRKCEGWTLCHADIRTRGWPARLSALCPSVSKGTVKVAEHILDGRRACLATDEVHETDVCGVGTSGGGRDGVARRKPLLLGHRGPSRPHLDGGSS
jgi:hypothetical protein